MPAPSREGTPIDIVVNKREDRKAYLEGGKGELPSKDAAHLKGTEKVKAKKKLWAEEDEQRGRGDGQEKLNKNKKKHPVKDHMTRCPRGARGLNPMMKDQRLKGINPMALR